MAGKSAITRDEIVEAAYGRARSQGLASLSVRAIARDCGVAAGTLYNYFPDKSSLVTDILSRRLAQFFYRAKDKPGGHRAIEGLEQLMADVVDDMRANEETIPEPLAERKYSGTFNVRIGEHLHRDLAMHAAEQHMSLNQFVVKKLAAS